MKIANVALCCFLGTAALLPRGAWSLKTSLRNGDESRGNRRRLGNGNGGDVNLVVEWNDLTIEWVRQSERGPTISGHFMAMVNCALFDSWAAFESDTIGTVVADLDSIRVDPSMLSGNGPSALQKTRDCAMTEAAYRVLTYLGQTMLSQTYLEIENGEDASVRLPLLLAEAESLRQSTGGGFGGLSQANSAVAEAVASEVVAAVMSRVASDGSNQPGDYADDTSGYSVTSWISPVPILTDPRTDYDFITGTFVDGTEWTYNTFDPAKASKKPNPGFAQVHPLVKNGNLKLTETYQSLTEQGIFPPDADGGQQFPLTPHWGGVTPFTIPTGDALREDVFGPYDKNGHLNDEWVNEAREVVELALTQQAKRAPRNRAESEYWELGDEFEYPPGWWVQRAADIARLQNLDQRTSLALLVGTSLTVFDSGVAAWEMKYYHDTVRPVTTINECFFGSIVSDWRGNRKAVTDDKDLWRPYQLRRNIVPPFPDIPSGHSAFSSSAAVVLRNLLGTNLFGYITDPFVSRFDRTNGFNGDPVDGNEEVTLTWDTLSQAADAAGFSRLLGGIHMMQGNMKGLTMGMKVGHSTLSYLRAIFGDANLGEDPVSDIDSGLVFGTGRDDSLSVPAGACDGGGPVEVYGFYGSDVLEAIGVNCEVSLFGGDGDDTFRVSGSITGLVRIRDYEEGKDSIVVLGSAAGPFTVTVSSRGTYKVTTLLAADGSAAAEIDGEWNMGQLDVTEG